MSGIRELTKNILATIRVLNGSREADCVRIAHDLYAQVQNRIIQTGMDSNGIAFPDYSVRQMSKKKVLGRSRNASAESRVKGKKGNTISYVEFRTLNLLQVKHVDLFLTGEMWKNTGVKVISSVLGRVTVLIDGKTPQANKKIDLNSERYKTNILEPSAQEIDAAGQAFSKRRMLKFKI